MGMSVGASGAFGILLNGMEDLLELYCQFIKAIEPKEDEDPCDWDSQEEFWQERADPWKDRFVQALDKLGITVPPGATMMWTGCEDDRASGRSATPADEWVLGWGLYAMPWEYPAMADSFKAHAMWHTWCWSG